MSEKENSFRAMTSEEGRSAAIKQGEMLQKGAEITESGRLEATPEQIDIAKVEMLAEKTTQGVKELVDSLGSDIATVIEQLKSEQGVGIAANSDPAWNFRKNLISFLVSIYNSR